jgi:hypothetical protein
MSTIINNLNNHILTLEAIESVRKELIDAEHKGNSLIATDAIHRLNHLYASINVEEIIEMLEYVIRDGRIF